MRNPKSSHIFENETRWIPHENPHLQRDCSEMVGTLTNDLDDLG
jgi:hypothetical protein